MTVPSSQPEATSLPSAEKAVEKILDFHVNVNVIPV